MKRKSTLHSLAYLTIIVSPPRPHRRHQRLEHAAESLSRVAPLVTRWVERLLAAHDPPLTTAQYLALHAVAQGELVGSELARRTAVSPAAVSQLLASLEDAVLLERARSTDDRRRHDLTLSAAGLAVLQSTQDLMRSELGTLLAELPPPETDALARLLETVEALLSGAIPPPRPHRHPPPPPPAPH
jgi:DNA-binding MarR family transcriptional regulator